MDDCQVAGAGYKVKFTLNGAQEPATCSGTWPSVVGHVSSACREGNSRHRESFE